MGKREEAGWIGVDLDGTLAHYESGYGQAGIIGAPIPRMVERVKGWLAEGKDVRIVTARITHPKDQAFAFALIRDWCLRHLGAMLPVRSSKDWQMLELWDDRAVQVIVNTGMTLDEYYQHYPEGVGA